MHKRMNMQLSRTDSMHRIKQDCDRAVDRTMKRRPRHACILASADLACREAASTANRCSTNNCSAVICIDEGKHMHLGRQEL